MNFQTVIIVIAAWMLLLIGGYLILSGDEQTTPNAQAPTPATTTEKSQPPTAQPAPAPAPSTTPTTPTSPKAPAPSPTTTQPRGDVGVPLTPEEAISTDPEDNNPRLKAKTRKIAREQALLQDLPYTQNGYTVENTDVNRKNQIIVTVTYPGSKGEAVSLYKRLLRKAGDDGGAYKVVYRKAS